MGATLQLDILLTESDYPVPDKVYIRGDVSPVVKKKLQRWLYETLGIAEENQIWT